MAPKTNREGATAEWRERHSQVRTLLGEIEVHLGSEAEKVTNDGATWPQVGDLGHLREQLKEVVAFLRGGAR
jgi:hypothetical protein